MLNAMTVDVEDYFQVSAFEPYIPRSEWERIPSRVERNVDTVLRLFDRHRARATFFLLGWIAERYPAMVRRIAGQGHEIASHGYSHVRSTQQTPEEFRLDVTRTKALLEDVAGCEVNGFRAASFSIGERNLWALDVLAEVGYLYSSSIYPVRHDHYGMPSAPRFAFRHRESSVLEIPITTIEVLGRKLPCGGGGYFRLFPYALSRWALRRVNRRDGQPTVFFFHPWEVDPEQPRQQDVDLRARFRHYVNLHRMESRLERLLVDFRWDSMARVFLGTERRESRDEAVAGRPIRLESERIAR
jgi:polysaccharide deacetylase family protein (PEP-CTERM system associated)